MSHSKHWAQCYYKAGKHSLDCMLSSDTESGLRELLKLKTMQVGRMHVEQFEGPILVWDGVMELVQKQVGGE